MKAIYICLVLSLLSCGKKKNKKFVSNPDNRGGQYTQASGEKAINPGEKIKIDYDVVNELNPADELAPSNEDNKDSNEKVPAPTDNESESEGIGKEETGKVTSQADDQGQVKEEDQKVELDAEEKAQQAFVDYYTPQTEKHYADTVYMQRIEALLEKIAEKESDSELFLKIAKTVAWTESNWRHYSLVNNEIYVIAGDDNKSFGIYQIYSKYHGVIKGLIENIEYAVKMLHEIYQEEQNADCESGTNVGSHLESMLRRIYATYNGGGGNRCRDGHKNDDKFLNDFQTTPWQDYL
jgi:hypothetical protein